MTKTAPAHLVHKAVNVYVGIERGCDGAQQFEDGLQKVVRLVMSSIIMN